jgi:general secretion pathway protein A
MYEHVFHFFGLRENPFGVSPDPRFYVSTPAYDTALAELIRGVDAPQGFIVLTGEAGTGKTTLLNHFLNWLRERQRSSSYVFHPRLKPAELFDCILRDFGVSCESQNKEDLLVTLCHWLIRRHAMGDSPVVVIDEAQAISVRMLDQLRLLLNLQSEGRKLLQIVLAGQPELDEKLRRPELRALRKRVMFHGSLLPFSMEETSQYVKSRLARTGTTNADVFAKESLEATHRYARGIPRTVNLLCEQALITGYAERVKIISPDIIQRVAADFDLTAEPAAAEEHKISPRFGRLTSLRPEETPTQVAPEIAAVESAQAETMMLEPAAPGIRQLKPGALQEVEPALIIEEAKTPTPPAATPMSQPVAASVPTMPRVMRLIAKPAEDPEHASPKKLPVGWQSTRVGERFVRYWKEMRSSFARDWKQFMKEPAAAAPANQPMAAAVPTLPRVMRTIAKPGEDAEHVAPKELPVGWHGTGLGERFVRYWMEVRASFARDWKQSVKEPAAATPANPSMAADVTTLPRVMRQIAKPAEDPEHVPPKELPIGWHGNGLGERFVRYWMEVKASFTHDWKQFMKERAAIAPANRPMAAAVPTLPRIMRPIAKPEEDPEVASPKTFLVGWHGPGPGDRFARYWKEVRASFVRDWKQFMAADGPVWVAARKRR